MIYVTVGSAIGGAEFDRLIKKIDEIASHFEEEFVVQLGASNYLPKNFRWFHYIPFEKSLEYFEMAQLVIGHCGAGTIINAVSFGKPLIVMPRLVKFNENSDDHQLEIANLLEQSQIARVVYDIKDLESVIQKALQGSRDSEKSLFSIHKRNLIDKMRGFLTNISR